MEHEHEGDEMAFLDGLDEYQLLSRIGEAELVIEEQSRVKAGCLTRLVAMSKAAASTAVLGGVI